MNKIFFTVFALCFVFSACSLTGGRGGRNTADPITNLVAAFGGSCTNNSDCASSICNTTFNKCGCDNATACQNNGICASNGLCVNINPEQTTCTKGFSSLRFTVLAAINSDSKDITSSCTFTSDTPSLATPNQDGSFNCLDVGQTDIKATLPSTYDGKTISATLKINDVFTVSPEPATCVVGSNVNIVAKSGSTVVTDSANWSVIGGAGEISTTSIKGNFTCNAVGVGQYEAKTTAGSAIGSIQVTPVGGCTNPRLDPNTKTGAINSYVCFDPYCGTSSQVSNIFSWGPTGSTVAQPVWYSNRGGCYKCQTAGTMTVSITYAGSQTSSGTLTCN